MPPENPRDEKIEWLDIGQIGEGDKISAIQFECSALFEDSAGGRTCGRCLRTVRIEETGKIDANLTADVCERQCPRCGKYTGFNFRIVARNVSPDGRKEELKPEEYENRQNAQDNLCLVLAGNLRHLSPETRWKIQELTKGRNLRLRFEVKSVQGI